jgi:glucosylceramidase
MLMSSCQNRDEQIAQWWLTDSQHGRVMFKQQTPIPWIETPKNEALTIQLDPYQRYQRMDGFGYTLTGGSAQHLQGMSKMARNELLKRLFRPEDDGIGISYLRISLGASDLDEAPFSYHDLANAEIDSLFQHFDLGPHRTSLIPVLQEILAIQPELKIMASPWSAPAWMKSNRDTRGGTLLPRYYDRYALYLATYIKQMNQFGIPIHAMTVQNEPLHPGNNPSMLMLADEMNDFVKFHLGPTFANKGIGTKILIYDHNADHIDYPLRILDDPATKTFVAGTAFHLYAGQIESLSEVHRKHPDREIHFTEQWTAAPGQWSTDLPFHIKKVLIGSTRHWSRTVFQWNLTNNPTLTPYTDRGGCSSCLGAVTIDGDQVTPNPAYYVLAHAAKWVRPGSVRIASTMPKGIPNVAFETVDGQIVLLMMNELTHKQWVRIPHKSKFLEVELQPGHIVTLII